MSALCPRRHQLWVAVPTKLGDSVKTHHGWLWLTGGSNHDDTSPNVNTGDEELQIVRAKAHPAHRFAAVTCPASAVTPSAQRP
eukprot:COSAG04_NODE_14398_length_569_cov_1.636170_1_plen_82_part_01